MALTEFTVRAAKPAAKDTKLFDERGLYLLVCANGSNPWRLKYRFSGREKLLSALIRMSVSRAREMPARKRGSSSLPE